MAYNQNANNQNVRVGNWYEELRLQELTGCRYYPSPNDKQSGGFTRERCFVHTEQTLPKDYASTTRSEYVPPFSRPEASWSLQSTGPRQRLREKELRNKSDNTFDTQRMKEFKESMVVDYRSEATMKFGKDGFKNTLVEKDPSIRQYTNHASYLFETPITFYSDLIRKGGNVNFPTSFICSSQPFRKNNAFTADPRSSIKPRAESNERPSPLPTTGDYQGLQRMKTRLFSHVRALLKSDVGRTSRSIVSAIWNSFYDSESDQRLISEVNDVFSANFDFRFTAEETKNILRSFGSDDQGSISLVEFSIYLRPIPNLRRLELINSLFSMLDTANEGRVHKGTVEKHYGGENVANLLDDMAAIHVSSNMLMTPATPSRPRSNRASTASVTHFNKNDFIDYYCDVSAEVEEDHVFERLLSENWSF